MYIIIIVLPMVKATCTRLGRKIRQPKRFCQSPERDPEELCDLPKSKWNCHSQMAPVNDETGHVVSTISHTSIGVVNIGDVADLGHVGSTETHIGDSIPSRCTSATSMTEEARMLVADGFFRLLSDMSDTPPGRTGSATSVDSGPICALSASDML